MITVGADIIRPFKKRWFAEEHLIRHFVPPSPQGEGYALRVTWESLFRLFCNKLQKIHLPLWEG